MGNRRSALAAGQAGVPPGDPLTADSEDGVSTGVLVGAELIDRS
jgi:hypothetical protein